MVYFEAIVVKYFAFTISPFTVGVCLYSKILQCIVYIVILNKFFPFFMDQGYES